MTKKEKRILYKYWEQCHKDNEFFMKMGEGYKKHAEREKINAEEACYIAYLLGYSIADLGEE